MTKIFTPSTLLAVLLCFWLYNSFISFGAFIEQNFFPVRVEQHNENVQFFKDSNYFCWDYFNFKVRDKTAITTIVILKDSTSKKGYLFTPFKRASLSPWNLSTDIQPASLEQPFCIYFPPGFTPAIPFEVDQQFIYHGFLGLWDISTKVPTIYYNERNAQYDQ